eukprot:6985614-Pyramimonas_sp.AAC.1
MAQWAEHMDIMWATCPPLQPPRRRAVGAAARRCLRSAGHQHPRSRSRVEGVGGIRQQRSDGRGILSLI